MDAGREAVPGRPSMVNRKLLWIGLTVSVLGLGLLLGLGDWLWEMDRPGHAPYGAVTLVMIWIVEAIGTGLLTYSADEKIKATHGARVVCTLVSLLVIIGGVWLFELSRALGLAVTSLAGGPMFYGIAPLLAAFGPKPILRP
jgi:hypothetical protein